MTSSTEGPASRSRSRRPDEALLALIVEDEPAQQLMLRTAFEARSIKVATASTGLDALRILAVQEPDLVTLDLGLPDFDGVELCRRIRKVVKCPIIIVSADGDEQRMVEALDIGADDYVTKPFRTEMLMARVRVALRHAAALATASETTTFEVGDLFLDVEAHLALLSGVPMELSPRQFRLLTALIRNSGRVLTHKQLAIAASADDLSSGEVATADGLRGAMSHLRKRLGNGANRPAIVTEPHVGYRLVPPA
jgi:two-component system, OmpR family, KDP operon response regulator KdpE